jgi:hypothetical protein
MFGISYTIGRGKIMMFNIRSVRGGICWNEAKITAKEF